MLADASNNYLSSKGDSRSLNRKLIALGRTRGSIILGEPVVAPVFGLTSIERMMKFLKTPEHQLRLLRTYAARYFSKADSFDVILRYHVPVTFRRDLPLEHPVKHLEEADADFRKDGETSQKGITYSLLPSSHGYVRPQLRPDGTLGPCAAGVGSRRSSSTKKRSRSRSRGSKFAHLGEGTINDHLALSGHSLQLNQDETADVPQSLDLGCQDVTVEGSGVPNDVGDVAMDKNNQAPRIETHLADDTEDVTDQAASAEGAAIIEYATALPQESSQLSCATALYRWMDPKRRVEGLAEEEFAERLICREKPEHLKALDHVSDIWTIPHDFFRQSAMDEDVNLVDEGSPECSYECFVGDPNSAAMFVNKVELERCKNESGLSNWARTRPPIKMSCDLKDLQAALDENIVNEVELLAAIDDAAKDSYYSISLRALAAAYKIYNEFEGATISPSAVTKPIYLAKWAQNMKSKTGSCLSSISLLDRLQSFACIAYFESGCLDMSPSQFDNAMALSTGDSIYVAAWLICDPAERQPANAVCRLHGNVGKAGLILLVPPAEPKMLAPEVDNWKFIDREEFDGTVTNAFSGTSLHLSFTDWCIPVDVGGAGRGQRDAEAYIIESLVSVYDRGKWIADLDVLQALNKGCSQPDHEFFYKSFCNHVFGEAFDAKETFPPIVTIKNWDEFLEHPKSPAVAMAHKNWDAKLALAVLGVRRGDRVFVLDRICKICYTDVHEIGGPDYVAKTLFLL